MACRSVGSNPSLLLWNFTLSPQILDRQVLSGRVGEAAMEDMPSCVAGIAKLLRMLAGLGRGKGTFQLTEEATGDLPAWPCRKRVLPLVPSGLACIPRARVEQNPGRQETALPIE